jgi:hypothetical protein
MRLVTSSFVNEYLKQDNTKYWLDQYSDSGQETLICQQWLRSSAAKRCIYESLYGDLFKSPKKTRILDIGGGLTALTPILAAKHDYRLVDLLAHDSLKHANQMMDAVKRNFVSVEDWATLKKSRYDLILANDIFPNVDQRLQGFLETYLPQATEIKVLLTWYETPRYYSVKRTDGEELMYMLAWNGKQLQGVLEEFSASISSPDLSIFKRATESVFPNGRHTCIVKFNGIPSP